VTLRLRVLESGHATPKRLFIQLMERVSRARFDDVARTSLYRPSFFGRAWLRFARGVMRGPSDWSPGERELLAAFASWLNRCPFCVAVHTRTAALGLVRPVEISTLERWRADPSLDARIRGAFGLLEKRATDPSRLGPADLAELRAAGVSDDAIDDVLSIAFMFDLINRLANVFGYTTVDDAGSTQAAKFLHRFGYRMPGILLR
jgi:uncharacterized peroxidase-related enzyme